MTYPIVIERFERPAPARAPQAPAGLQRALELFGRPLFELVHQAHAVHRAHHDPGRVELCAPQRPEAGVCPPGHACCPQPGEPGVSAPASGRVDAGQAAQAAAAARAAGPKACGSRIGLEQTRAQRAALLAELAALPVPPESVPIDRPAPGWAPADAPDGFEWVRTVAVARLLLPASVLRLSAGRPGLDDALQAMCLYAGANAICFDGAPQAADDARPAAGAAWRARDRSLLARLDLAARERPA